MDDGEYSAFEESSAAPSPMNSCTTPVSRTFAASAASVAAELAALPGAADAMGPAVHLRYGIKGQPTNLIDCVDADEVNGDQVEIPTSSSSEKQKTLFSLGLQSLQSDVQADENGDEDGDKSYSAFEESCTVATPLISPASSKSRNSPRV